MFPYNSPYQSTKKQSFSNNQSVAQDNPQAKYFILSGKVILSVYMHCTHIS